MQYITQCPRYQRLITRRPRKDNYLLSQIVKEQPKDVSKKHRSTSRTSAMLIAASSIASPLAPHPMFLVEPTGIEPVTSCLQSRRSPS